jgi:glycosyltransferase involved in cell wall biosynthesis
VITSCAPACPEVVGGAALIVDPDDVDGLAAAMLRLACEPGLAGALRARGLIRAAEFSWHEGAGRLLAELTRVGRAGSA